MIIKRSAVVAVIASLLSADTCNAFSLSRRESFQKVVGGVATAGVVIPGIISSPANALDQVEFSMPAVEAPPSQPPVVAATEAPPAAPAAPAAADGEAAPVAAATPATGEEEKPVVVEEKPKYVSKVSEDTPRTVTRMGGLLEPFQDGLRGVRIMAPSGWNKFEGEVGAYDLKWQDLVDQSENIKVSSSPVKSTTKSIVVLGDPQIVGENLAKKRNAKLISASERLTDGILFYKFDFAIKDGTHQLLQLCVCKGKLWSIDANSSERRWAKRSELYENVLGSFMPKLA